MRAAVILECDDVDRDKMGEQDCAPAEAWKTALKQFRRSNCAGTNQIVVIILYAEEKRGK